MKKLLTLVLLLPILFGSSKAQTTNACNAEFTIQYLSVNQVGFNPVITGDPLLTHHLWKFGDGSTSNGATPTHVYLSGGAFIAKHFVYKTNLNGTVECRDSFSRVVQIQPLCDFVANFSFSTTTTPFSFHFQNTSFPLHNTDSIRWTFGDGTSSNQVHPNHTYTQPGAYTVCLRVQKRLSPGTMGCVREICKTVVVGPLCNIQPRFTWAADPNNPGKIIFTNQTIVPTASATATWSFGDGTTSTGWNSMHEYAQPGRYRVCLKIQTGPNCITYTCDSITVIRPCNIVPRFTWLPDQSNPQKIIFTNQTISPTSAAIATWSFGDGTSSTGWNAIHEYAQPGRYYVCLKIQLTPSCIRYYCDTVIVHRREIGCIEQSYFTIRNSTADRQLYHFNPAFANPAWQYTWTFGDGTGSHEISPVHRYARPGEYTACLTVFRNPNCASTSCKPVRVLPQPNCDSVRLTFNYQHDPILVNKFYFYAIANSQITSQTWTITKLPGTISTPPVVLHQNNPMYIFRDTGYYRVCLRAVMANGCVKEFCKVIRVQRIATTNACVLQVYPNPASTQVNMIALLSQPQLIHVYVYNSLNILVKEKHQQGVAGSNIITLAIGDLVSGSYNVRVVRGNDVCYARFQKL